MSGGFLSTSDKLLLSETYDGDPREKFSQAAWLRSIALQIFKINIFFTGISLQFITRLFQAWLKEKKDAASIISTLKKNEMDDKLLVSK
jgi:hypothetical protein